MVSGMREWLILVAHLIVTIVKIATPGGARSVVAESLILKHQTAATVIEDDALVEIALAPTSLRDDRAEAAASVLGPRGVGRIIDAYLAAGKVLRDVKGQHNKAAGDRFHELRARIFHTPRVSLIAAVQARAATTDSEEIAELAGLLSRGRRRRPC
jgi:hypothetical protein